VSPRLRRAVFLLACVCLLPAFAHVASTMPAFGAHPLPYGDLINAVGVRERHVTNMVSAINFDYRGFDTLGEEFMLLCAVTGTTILLRGTRGETQDRPQLVPGREIRPRADSTVLICRLLAGGGFQGGVIIASGLLLAFLGEGYRGWRHVAHSELFDAAEGGGAALYALCGFASMLMGLPFLQNMLPLGKIGDLFSGGLMLVENAGVGLAVAGGFGILLLEFLEETREPEPVQEDE
jgi:multicomponent Na+:H+ antiporter subunit B